VAFGVGGIPEWLLDGINGHLAPAPPPLPFALAESIALALRDPSHYRDLCEGARKVAMQFSVKRHVESLLPVFENLIKVPTVSSPF
jgi:glycosyltransferase involved in cell wall biosynthesis